MASLPFDSAVILGSTGPTGVHLAEVLRAQGVRLRLASRSVKSGFMCDATDPEQVIRAVEGFPVVFDCIGLPGDQMRFHPVVANNIARAIRAGGTRCVQISSFWSYLPLQQSPLTEQHPRIGGTEWVRLRREAEDILLAAGAAVLQLPDFYGPHVHASSLQQPLHEAALGKTMNWIGSADTQREYIYVPDAMTMAARIAGFDQAYGQRWLLPGGGPLSGNDVAQIASQVLGRTVRVRGSGMLILRVASLFNAGLRSFLQMAPEYMKPIAYDAARTRSLLGDVSITPYAKGIRRTLEWMAQSLKV